MSSGKFNTIGIEGDPNGVMRKPNHGFPYQIIVPCVVDGSNNATHPSSHHWPAELTHILRPAYKEYRVSNDLSWTLFTKYNKAIEPYTSIMNPCCEIHKDNGSSMTFMMSCFDYISRAFISNGEIHNKVIGIYLSATRTNGHYYAWRDCMILMPNSEAIAKAKELNLMVGVASFIGNFSGPSYLFNVISNPQAWDTCSSFR